MCQLVPDRLRMAEVWRRASGTGGVEGDLIWWSQGTSGSRFLQTPTDRGPDSHPEFPTPQPVDRIVGLLRRCTGRFVVRRDLPRALACGDQ
jgi:hypothetical protein